MAATTPPVHPQLITKAIHSNLVIQKALTTQALELETQVKELDELIEGVNQVTTSEEVIDEAPQGEFQIPGSKRPSGPIPSFELLSQKSPFYKEAFQRAHYLRSTSVRPIKGKEAEVLTDAVKKENMRLEAYRARDDPAAPTVDIMNNTKGINWSIVAEKVSDQSSTKRTPDECRIQWIGNLHPRVNHGNWTQTELNKLHDLTTNELATGGKINWLNVSKDLGTNRIPMDCMKQAITRPRHHWDVFNDQKLLKAVQLFGTNNWNLVARYVSPYATTSQCQSRYVRSADPGIKRGTWSPEEDDRLQKAFAVFGNSWIDVAGVLPGRTNEQCRERWGEVSSNHGGKGEWLPEEDQKLLDLVSELGNKWKAISLKIGNGRTGPHCRLRHDKLIRMRARQTEELAVAASGEGPLEATANSPIARALETVALGSSSTPSGSTSPVLEIAVSRPPPSPVLAETKARRRKSKRVEELSRVATQEATIAPLPSQQDDLNIVLPKSRPRPRPRPTYKGRGKEGAVNDDTLGRGGVVSAFPGE